MTTIRFVILYGMVTLSAGSAFVVHLALRNQNVALGYEAERARAESARLRSQINQYRLELGAQRAPGLLMAVGRSERGMVEPDQVTTLIVGGSLRPGRASGRPR
ncbi:MAG: hypothetical protein EPO40_13655 [Myxococcaceae bacterium]|nr:MAG: hypothetical protein EPO40_13655 [Myxococcaceae bacterium]